MNKKIFACIAAVIMSAFMLCSCSEKSANAMEYNDPNGKVTAAASQGLMSLWIGVQKDSSSDYLAFVEAENDGWNMVLDEESGKTFKEMFRDDCTLSLRNLLAVEYLHDYVFGFEFSDEQQKSVEKKIADITSSFGSEKLFEQEMQKYGATIKDYERYLCLMLKQTTLVNTFYSEKGMRVITEEQKREYFKDKYAVVYHIFIDTRGVTKDDGTTVSLTEEEKQLKREHANSIYAQIQNGEISFEDALLKYTEDAYASQYASGYFVANDGRYPSQFTDGVFSLVPGEITMVETSSGLHIIKRYPMDESLYDDDESVYEIISQNLITQDFSGLVSSVSDGVRMNDEVIGQLDASLVKPFAGF